jgi:hypothetical protein
MNGRFSRCAAAKYLALAKHFVRCERTQHKLNTSAVGSELSFAAPSTNVRSGPEPTRPPGMVPPWPYPYTGGLSAPFG